MPGLALTWQEQLAAAVASNISDMIAPLEALFTVHRTGLGVKGVKVPTASAELTMEDIVAGVPGGTDVDYNFTGETVTPVPCSVQIPVAEIDLENAEPSQIDDLIARMTVAAHKKILGKIGAAMTARLTADYSVGTGTAQAMNIALARAGRWKVRTNKGAGPLGAILTAEAAQELEDDFVSKNMYAALTGTILEGADVYKFAGATWYPDVYLGDDGTVPHPIEYNLIACKNGVHIAYAGTGPRVKVLPTTDPVNVRLAMALYVAADIPNPNLACWMKTEAGV